MSATRVFVMLMSAGLYGAPLGACAAAPPSKGTDPTPAPAAPAASATAAASAQEPEVPPELADALRERLDGALATWAGMNEARCDCAVAGGAQPYADRAACMADAGHTPPEAACYQEIFQAVPAMGARFAECIVERMEAQRECYAACTSASEYERCLGATASAVRDCVAPAQGVIDDVAARVERCTSLLTG